MPVFIDKVCCFTIVLTVLGLRLLGNSDTIPFGKQIDSVACIDSYGQSYALYVPTHYDASQVYPVIFFLDAAARGQYPVERFIPAAERWGFILAGSNNSQNGPIEPIIEAVEAVSYDVQSRLSIDPERIYLSGFSGGARAAVTIAMQVPNVRGVIACGAGFPLFTEPTSELGFSYLAVCGDKDMNFLEMDALTSRLDDLQVSNCFIAFDGGHDWPDSATAMLALRWLATTDSQSRTLACSNLPAQRQRHTLLNDAIRKTEGAYQEQFNRDVLNIGLSRFGSNAGIRAASYWIDRASKFRELADSSAAKPERLMGKRLIDYYWRNAYIQYDEFRRSGHYEQARMMAEIWTRIQPESSVAYFHLAKANALLNRARASASALDQAIERGMTQRKFIDADPAFDQVRTHRRFAEVMKRFEGAK